MKRSISEEEGAIGYISSAAPRRAMLIAVENKAGKFVTPPIIFSRNQTQQQQEGEGGMMEGMQQQEGMQQEGQGNITQQIPALETIIQETDIPVRSMIQCL